MGQTASKETPAPERELDGFITVFVGRSGTGARGTGDRGRGGGSCASMAPGHPLPSSPRGWSWLPARPSRSGVLVARRLCFGDTRVFGSPERVERSQSLHCSRVTAGLAASAGARALPTDLPRPGRTDLPQAALPAPCDLRRSVTGTRFT